MVLEHPPHVSVILAVYNQAHYLRDAIDSVLNQSYKDYEIIAVDDGSTDASLQLLHAYDVPPLSVADRFRVRR